MPFNIDGPLRPLTGRVERKSSKVRNALGDTLEDIGKDAVDRNFGNGEVIGLAGAGLIVILEDTVGIPFGAGSEIVDSEAVEGGTVYTIDVNAPTKNIAEMRAFLDSTTGFASLLTDKVETQDIQVINFRPGRDTHQIEIEVRD